MKRLDEHRASLVEFMRSIRNPHHRTNNAKHAQYEHYDHEQLPEHFAGLKPQPKTAKKGAKSKPGTGDKAPIRSAN